MSKVKILGEFTSKDYENAAKSLELVKYLLPDLVFTNKPVMFWMDSKEFDGLTIGKKDKFIVIDKYFKFKEGKIPSNIDYFKFSVVYAHEKAHEERNLNENDTQALTDRRLLQILFTEPDRIKAWSATDIQRNSLLRP